MGSRLRKLRVLAADDSAVMRGVMRTVFQLHAGDVESDLPRMELCGLAKDGNEALEAVRTLSPDVLLLDLEMPGLNGLGVLEKLRAVAPNLPVIMCSAYTERGARSTLEALAAGAKDYVMKPGPHRDFTAALDALMEQLLPKIAALAAPAAASWHRSRVDAPVHDSPAVEQQGNSRVEVVVIGVSTGGPSALEAMLPQLAIDFPVPIMIVQHMPKLFTGALADRLDRLCRLSVREARAHDVVKPGTILLAPGDCHMEIATVSGSHVVKMHQGPSLNSCKPAADYLFRSAVRSHGSGTLALVMTGMGSDGLDGAEEVHRSGGVVLAQDEATSAVWGMPGRVARAGLAQATLPLGMLARELSRRVAFGRFSQRNTDFVAVAGNGTQRPQEVIHGML